MPKTAIQFAKISATPTLTSWGQAYNAGGLFATISLSRTEPEEVGLNLLGKDFISNLEAEFFTLEEKTLETIKKALAATLEKLPANIHANIVIGYIVDRVIYLFLIGNGSVIIKRTDQTGVLLQPQTSTDTIKNASGVLQTGDVLILQTEQFTKLVSQAELFAAIDHQSPDDIAESLSPKIHGAEEGGAAAVILSYTEPETSEEPLFDEADLKATVELSEISEPAPPLHPHSEMEEKQHYSKEHKSIPSLTQKLSALKNKLPKIPLSHPKKLYLSIVVILITVLIGSVVVTKQNQESAETKKVFADVYKKAEIEYQEGEGLMPLNKNLARDNFLKAQQILLESKDKFKPGSEEQKQITALLEKVETNLSGTSEIRSVSPKKADEGDAPLLNTALKQKSLFVAATDDAQYVASNKGIYQLTDEKLDQIIENDGDWSKLAGFGAFGSNLYILDKEEGVLKFTAAEEGYGKSNYFAGSAPDLKTAVDMAIDGSIWIGLSDGTILKYTKGAKDAFSVTGLDKPLGVIKSLYTTTETDFLYVLDSSNSRVIKLGKDGAYSAQFSATELKNAQKIMVSDDEQILYFLSDNDLWQIPLK